MAKDGNPPFEYHATRDIAQLALTSLSTVTALYGRAAVPGMRGSLNVGNEYGAKKRVKVPQTVLDELDQQLKRPESRGQQDLMVKETADALGIGRSTLWRKLIAFRQDQHKK